MEDRDTVAGYVLRHNEPLAGLQVAALREVGQPEVLTTTDAEGFFSFFGPFLRAEVRDPNHSFTPAQINEPNPRGLLTVFREMANLKGRIQNAPLGIAGQQAFARSWDGSNTYTATINADGTFAFLGVLTPEVGRRFRVELPASFNGGAIVPNVFRVASDEPMTPRYFLPAAAHLKVADNSPFPASAMTVQATRAPVDSAMQLSEQSSINGWTSADARRTIDLSEVNIPTRAALNGIFPEGVGVPVGAIFQRSINLEANTAYTFSLLSDDGSVLMLDDEILINNDGLHGAITATVTYTPSSSGVRTLKVRFFDGGGEASVALQSSVSGGPLTNVPGPWSAVFMTLPTTFTRQIGAAETECDPLVTVPFAPLAKGDVTFTATMVGAQVTPNTAVAAEGQSATFTATGGLAGRVTDAFGNGLAGLPVRALLPGAGACENYFNDFSGPLPAGSTLGGSAVILNGGLRLTDNAPGQVGTFSIDDFQTGLPAQSVRATFRVRIGEGTGADGLHLILDGAENDLEIAFDTYRNADDEPSIQLSYGGQRVATRFPYDVRRSDWVVATLSVSSDGKVDLTFGGDKIFEQQSTGWRPSNFLFTLRARTGGSWDRHWVDDLNVSVKRGDFVTLTDANGNYDFGPSLINSGAIVQPLSSSYSFAARTVGTPASGVDFRAFGAAPLIGLIADQTMNEDGSLPLNLSLVAPGVAAEYLSLSAVSDNLVLFPNSGLTITGNGTNRSMTLNPTFNQSGVAEITLTSTEIASGLFNVTVVKANTNVTSIVEAEKVLSTPALQASSYLGASATINFENQSGPGNFPATPFPGLNGDAHDNFVVEVSGRLTIPTSGEWTFGVRSDEGFELYVGSDHFAVPGLRAAGDSLETFNLPAGTYPVRLVYFDAVDGAGVGAVRRGRPTHRF